MHLYPLMNFNEVYDQWKMGRQLVVIIFQIIKTSESVILPFLTKLFKFLFDNSEFSDAWIESLLVPIFKKGNPYLRPIIYSRPMFY